MRGCLSLLALLVAAMLAWSGRCAAATLSVERGDPDVFGRSFSARLGVGADRLVGHLLWTGAPIAWSPRAPFAGPDLVDARTTLLIADGADRTVRGLIAAWSVRPLRDHLLDGAANAAFRDHGPRAARETIVARHHVAADLSWVALEAAALRRALARRPASSIVAGERDETLTVEARGVELIPGPSADRLAIIEGIWRDDRENAPDLVLMGVAGTGLAFAAFLLVAWLRARKAAAEAET